MNDLMSGTLAGTIATAPMTVVMSAIKALPTTERRTLPPREITENTLERAGLDDDLYEDQVDAATWAAHFAFGGAAGAIYGLVSSATPGHPAVKGAVFGVAVWTVSYLGWLPASGLFRSAAKDTAGRNAIMIGAHVVWGSVTGLLVESMGKHAGQ